MGPVHDGVTFMKGTFNKYKYMAGKSLRFACLLFLVAIFSVIIILYRSEPDSIPKDFLGLKKKDLQVASFKNNKTSRLFTPLKEEQKSLVVTSLNDWLSGICKPPTREELRALLKSPDVTLEQRLGIAWLDKGLLYEALGDQDLNSLTLEAALSLSDPKNNLSEFKSALMAIQPETANSSLILASHYLKSGDVRGAIELIKSLPAASIVGGNSDHRNAIQAALVGIGRDLSSAKYYASFAAPTPTGIVELIPQLFDIKSGQVGINRYVKPEDLKTIVPSAIALLQSSSSGNQLSVMDEGLGLEFESALLDFAQNQKLDINNSGVGYLEAKQQIAAESAELSAAMPSLFNDQAVFESLLRHGLVDQYIELKNSVGSAKAFNWLKENAPDTVKDLKAVMPSPPWTIR